MGIDFPTVKQASEKKRRELAKILGQAAASSYGVQFGESAIEAPGAVPTAIAIFR